MPGKLNGKNLHWYFFYVKYAFASVSIPDLLIGVGILTPAALCLPHPGVNRCLHLHRDEKRSTRKEDFLKIFWRISLDFVIYLPFSIAIYKGVSMLPELFSVGF